jgi:hypothetical protein
MMVVTNQPHSRAEDQPQSRTEQSKVPKIEEQIAIRNRLLLLAVLVLVASTTDRSATAATELSNDSGGPLKSRNSSVRPSRDLLCEERRRSRSAKLETSLSIYGAASPPPPQSILVR